MTTEDPAAELLALLRAQEARRKRRNRVLGWVAAAVALVALVAVPYGLHVRDAARQERAVREAYCDMTTDYGTARYYDCIG